MLAREIERKLDQKGDRHEIYALRSDVDRLENTVRTLSASLDGLRLRFEQMAEGFRQLSQT